MSKNSIKFLLKEPNIDNETLIYLVYRSGFTFKYSIREKVNPSNWNKVKQRMREIRGLPYRNFNERLDRIAKEFEEMILKLKNQKRFTIENISTEMNILMGFRKQQSLADYMLLYVTTQKERGNYDRVKSIETLRNKLLKYNIETCDSIDYQNINAIFFKRFKEWASNLSIDLKTGEKKYYTTNYIDKMASNLRRMMHMSFIEGHHMNDDYKNIKRMSEDVYKIYLTTEELKLLIDAKLPGYLSNARDIFLVGCFTGLRIGNYLKIDPDIQINLKTGYLTAICNKQGPRLTIPLHPELIKIINKNEGMPHAISEVKLNKYIKLACKNAGITDKIVWMRTEGGKRVEHVNEKYELVCSHTARRTFATNAYKAGISAFEIMQITGHRTESSFMRYIRITQEQAAERMKNHNFFKSL